MKYSMREIRCNIVLYKMHMDVNRTASNNAERLAKTIETKLMNAKTPKEQIEFIEKLVNVNINQDGTEDGIYSEGFFKRLEES